MAKSGSAAAKQGFFNSIAPLRSFAIGRLLDQSQTPQRYLEAFRLQRTRFEMIVERKLRRGSLSMMAT
jgi:hypothetical protein